MQKQTIDKELQPLKDKSKFTLIQSPITNKQILQIFQRTPNEHKHTRPAKGGGTWEYVTGVYIKKLLDFIFGWLWDFEVLDKGTVEVGGKIIQIWVQGRLTIRDPKTLNPMIVKTQFGGADVKYMKSNPKMPLDYANDMKAAATDALKKCASELGLASDIYGKNEFREIKEQQTPKQPTTKQQPPRQQPPQQQVNYLTKLKAQLVKKGAKTEQEAINLYNKMTGENIKSLKVAQSTAKKYLVNLLNTPMGK